MKTNRNNVYRAPSETQTRPDRDSMTSHQWPLAIPKIAYTHSREFVVSQIDLLRN